MSTQLSLVPNNPIIALEQTERFIKFQVPDLDTPADHLLFLVEESYPWFSEENKLTVLPLVKGYLLAQFYHLHHQTQHYKVDLTFLFNKDLAERATDFANHHLGYPSKSLYLPDIWKCTEYKNISAGSWHLRELYSYEKKTPFCALFAIDSLIKESLIPTLWWVGEEKPEKTSPESLKFLFAQFSNWLVPVTEWSDCSS